MPRPRSGVVLEPGEVFRLGLEEVGLNTYAYTTSGRRKLVRRRVAERVQVTPAGRAYFAAFNG